MKLYNTLTKQTEDFTPLDGNTVRMYSCGPTVYDHAHIGNLSAYIFADTLHRALRLPGWQVQHVMNYTDVDDKTIRRSREKYPHKAPREALDTLTSMYIDIFLTDMRRIGNEIDWITFMRATENITAMQALITRLYEKNFAYLADDGVYFSIEAYRKSGKTYGQLLEIPPSNTSEARIQNDEYDKESIHDFALWKKQKEGEPTWEFMLDGHNIAGRPGWHIECSAMSSAGLGQPFDIHTGGIDLRFPHHENEIAQSTAGNSNPLMAHFFIHNNHIVVNGKKMAKSANNFYTLEDITKKGYDPLAFRLMILQAHYRSQINFTWESLGAAQSRLNNWRAVAALRWQALDGTNGYDYGDYVTAADGDTHFPMFDDVNTPQVLANVDQRFTDYTDKLISKGGLHGFEIYLDTVDEILGLDLMDQPDISMEQKQLIRDREQTRDTKDWTKSDALRDRLKTQGIGLHDTSHGAIWFRV